MVKALTIVISYLKLMFMNRKETDKYTISGIWVFHAMVELRIVPKYCKYF
jgi:hypothetical protein